jgi:hypothetical protein
MLHCTCSLQGQLPSATCPHSPTTPTGAKNLLDIVSRRRRIAPQDSLFGEEHALVSVRSTRAGGAVKRSGRHQRSIKDLQPLVASTSLTTAARWAAPGCRRCGFCLLAPATTHSNTTKAHQKDRGDHTHCCNVLNLTAKWCWEEDRRRGVQAALFRCEVQRPSGFCLARAAAGLALHRRCCCGAAAHTPGNDAQS